VLRMRRRRAASSAALRTGTAGFGVAWGAFIA
jgi:hypothetical protein